ncbi:hypothetical protein N5079_11100 [Planotetraspora sp. A-T 1434]|nr:hypothetical protein [Planotetraspora sp. A-T 1434]MCT9930764.1 hypothetical protein [Planotetraspora sp. A-T 1434]
MSQHVHVRLSHGLAITEEGDLVEKTGCQCGATWTDTYRVEDGQPEP